MSWSSWHNHTGENPQFSYCADQDLNPDVYRRLLRQSHWQAFAITDHAFALALPDEEPWPNQWFHQPERLWQHRAFREDKTAKYLERLAKVCDGKRIFSGLEVEVGCDGSLSMESLLWPYLDVVIGSIHFLPGDREGWCSRHLEQLDMLLEYPIDILGHPFRELTKTGPVPGEILDETLLRARQAGVAIEINAHLPCPEDPRLLKRAVELGLRVAFGLDAHSREELSRHTYFEDVLRQSGVAREDIRLFRPVCKTPKLRTALVR